MEIIFIENIIENKDIESFWKDELLVSVLLSNYSKIFFDFFKNESNTMIISILFFLFILIFLVTENIVYLFVLLFLFCIGMFTGCAQTPDSSLVKPKGSKAVDAYTEADDVSGSKGEASESKNDDGSESKTTIRNLIDAPQNYKSHVEDDSAKLVVNTDASVEIPEVEKISAISVTAAEVTQELLDRITNAFFSEAKLYTMDSYYVKTKDEIKKTLDELKEDVANGNLDPYNYGTDDDGNYVYDIYEDIETWEQEYETAPEKKTLTEAKPVAGNFFDCIAQMPDDSQFYYKISSDGSDTLSVKIKKAANKGGEKIPEDAMWCDYGYSEEEEKPTEESIGLSLDEAKKLVKEKVEKMGITDLQFSNWNYAEIGRAHV